MAKAPKTTARPTGNTSNTATLTAEQKKAAAKAKRKAASGKRKVVKKVAYKPEDGATWQPVNAEGEPEGDAVLLVNEDGKYTQVPADYDPAIHKPLKRNEFADESMWFELAASVLEAKAAKLRQKAVDSKKLGGGKDRAKAKKLLAAMKRFADLKKSLSESGLNVDEILASMQEEEEVETETEGTDEAAE